MRKSVAVAVLVLAVLVSSVQAGWVRKTMRQVGSVSKKVIEGAAVKLNDPRVLQQIGVLVTKYGAGIIGGIGKRSAGYPMNVGENSSRAKQLLQELDRSCVRFSIDTKKGLSDQVMANAFKASDGNKDGTLNDNELNLFENIVDAFQHCVTMLKVLGK